MLRVKDAMGRLLSPSLLSPSYNRCAQSSEVLSGILKRMLAGRRKLKSQSVPLWSARSHSNGASFTEASWQLDRPGLKNSHVEGLSWLQMGPV